MHDYSRPIMVALLAATGAMPATAAGEADLAIRNVTVIDTENGTVTASRDVIVDDGRIVAVTGAAEDVAAEQDVDGSGKYLIPGLMNMHAHSSYGPLHEATLKLMTANGVTGIREMGSDCMKPGFAMCLTQMRESQAKIEAGQMVGPRMVELSTLKIQSERSPEAEGIELLYRPMTADEARVTVSRLVEERRPDILKIGDQFHPDAFRALAAEASDRGIKFGGHIPVIFSVADVAGMGMTSIEHARDLPLDCSTYGAKFRARAMAKIMGEDVDWPDRKQMPARARDTYDEPTCWAQIAAMVDNGTYYVPTHLTRAMDYRAGEAEYRDDPRLAYITKMQQRHWNGDLDRTVERLGDIQADLADFYILGLVTTGMAHDAGVKVMAGTDANDTMIFPGFSLHDELENLVAAGLTPMEALQAATSVPAQYLGREGDFGGVSEGKLADLVLLNADPLADIANTTKIEAVIQGGVMHDRAALDALLGEVRSWVVETDRQMAEEE